MCLNNNGVQKVNFFFSFLILVENAPHPIFVVSCFFVIFIKAVLFSLLRMNLFHCRLRSLELLFFVLHSLDCIKNDDMYCS